MIFIGKLETERRKATEDITECKLAVSSHFYVPRLEVMKMSETSNEGGIWRETWKENYQDYVSASDISDDNVDSTRTLKYDICGCGINEVSIPIPFGDQINSQSS